MSERELVEEVAMSAKGSTQPAKLRPIPPPDPGVLVPGVADDVALGRIRRQIEVPRASLKAPVSALAGAAGVAHEAGQLARAERVMASPGASGRRTPSWRKPWRRSPSWRRASDDPPGHPRCRLRQSLRPNTRTDLSEDFVTLFGFVEDQ
jgi:hypothetical protein